MDSSPGRDDGPGLQADPDPAVLGWETADADLVVVGHTHARFERRFGLVRAVNVSSVSLPRSPRGANWSLLVADAGGYAITHHEAPYDLAEVGAALAASDHPTAGWLAGKLGLGRAPDS